MIAANFYHIGTFELDDSGEKHLAENLGQLEDICCYHFDLFDTKLLPWGLPEDLVHGFCYCLYVSLVRWLALREVELRNHLFHCLDWLPDSGHGLRVWLASLWRLRLQLFVSNFLLNRLGLLLLFDTCHLDTTLGRLRCPAHDDLCFLLLLASLYGLADHLG